VSPVAVTPSAPPAPSSSSADRPATVTVTTPSPVVPVESLPPPKSTTISLARTDDAKLDALLGEGDKAFDEGDLARAAVLYESAKRDFPKRAAPSVGVARVRVAKASPVLSFAVAEKNPDVIAAARDLKRAAGQEPAFGPGQVELGRALLLLGDASQAEAAFRKGVRILSDEPEAHSGLGVALLALGKTEEALAELGRARELDPGSGPRRGLLGTVLFMRGRVAEAIKEYETEARLSPDEPRVHSDLGTAHLAQGDMTRAFAELRRAIQLDPKRATFRSNLGYALQAAGKVGEAITEYREALKLDPRLVSAWVNLATALARDPKTWGEARQALKSAEAIDPSDPRVKANREELDALERGARP